MKRLAGTLDIENRQLSQKLFDLLKKNIPGGVNSPARAFSNLLSTPIIVKSGSGSIITDVDHHNYIDFCNSWGSLILGHCHPAITRAVVQRIEKGCSFGITTEEEFQLAEIIKQHYPSMEKLRFVSSGTEATMSAIRLARGYTGRELIIKFDGHYHGHADSLLIQAGSGVFDLNGNSSSLGVPKDFVKHTLSLPFNDPETCKRILNDSFVKDNLAAIILEPVAANMGVVPAEANFIQLLKEESERCGALLIFDEVVTGFRVGLKGAQYLYQIKPDLTCMGKIIGGGFPAAAFGGRADIMNYLAPEGGVYQAGTLSGNPVAMVAGHETISQVQQVSFYKDLEEKMKRLIEPVKHYIIENNIEACIQSVGSMWTLFFGKKTIKNRKDVLQCNSQEFKRFFYYMLERGIYLSPSPYEAHFVSDAHTDEQIDFTRATLIQFFNDR